MNNLWIKIFLVFIASHAFASANIKIIKKENPDSNTTMLVIGGIHGDEPGGYFSASILAMHYKITSKNLWIVPNLNKESIQANLRGINGDMNRKFSPSQTVDKDSEIVQEIKKIILTKNVSLVLNLHDGQGFYRKENKGNIFNPNSWGQSCVIDQCKTLKDQPFGNLDAIASTVKNNINKNLIENHHSFDVKNTNTKFDDEAMRLSLTYFAVINNKPAFAIESSKNLSSLSQKVFYHLLAIEEFMKIMNISFTRDFNLNEEGVSKILSDYGTLAINENIVLNFNDIKKSLNFMPMKKDGNTFDFSHPLGDFKKLNGTYIAYIGNKEIATLKPDYFKMASNCPKKINVEIDGKITSIDKSSDFFVNGDFKIIRDKSFRVNVIGLVSKNNSDESGISINLKSLNKDFSVDENKKIYRVEFYKDDDFCFMSKVHFK
ncbi:MAG: hypothetical protein NTZ60_06325 [Campylobacterales bacterium]|nr:hypothetical protein [Campylobacterales bacterium]